MSATELTATIGDLLEAGSVNVGVTASNKADLLHLLIDTLDGCDGVDDLQAIRDAVFERESRLSTGVGDGIAPPHAKTTGTSKTLAVFATLSAPTGFDSFDGKPVTLVFMLIGPSSASRQHVRLLGRISRLLQREHVRRGLIGAKTPLEIISVLQAAEEEIPAQ